MSDLAEVGAPACFLFSLGPDQTGRAISRVFRPGFFQKVSRTSVVQIYGVRTLLNGTLLPAPHIGRRNTDVMRSVRDAGYEVGIHCHNHYRWQDYLERMSLAEVRAELVAARAEFLRGGGPFFPRIGGKTFKTLEIPSTLPTFDELMGRPEYPDHTIVAHYLGLMKADAARTQVFTLHAEIEGMGRRGLFQNFLAACNLAGVEFIRMDDYARELLANRAAIPVRDQVMGAIDGRSGVVAVQAA